MLKCSTLLLAASLFLAPFPAQARLQCVPYARSISGLEIRGNAHTWWEQAEGRYAKAQHPEVNSVLVFQSTRSMPLGHVAVVRRILDERRIILDHANWSRPGMIERDALAVDVSEAGDWSEVRVWYGPTQSLGARTNPTYGFILPSSPAHPASQMALLPNSKVEM